MFLWKTLLPLCLLGPRLTAAQASDGSLVPQVSGFVTVNNNRFQLGGKPWFLAGTNMYYLLEVSQAIENLNPFLPIVKKYISLWI